MPRTIFSDPPVIRPIASAAGTQGTQNGETFVLNEIAGFDFGYFIFYSFWCWRAGARGRGCANLDVPQWRQ